MRFRIGYLACLGSLLFAPARAQNVRVTAGKGDVTVVRGDPAAPIPRSLDSVLVTEDRVVTGKKSQANVQVDSEHTFNLGADTEIRLGDTWPGHYEVALMKGGLTWSAGPSASDVDLQTPSVSVRSSQPGVYDISINANGESLIEPRFGAVEVVALTGSQWVSAGQKMVARGPYDNPEFRMANASRWRRFMTVLSNLQLGVIAAQAVADSTSGNPDGGRRAAFNNSTAPNPHSGFRNMSPPESRGGRAATPPTQASSGAASHPAPSTSHSAPAAGHPAPAASHSAPSSSAPAASHSAPASSTSTSSTPAVSHK